MRQKDTKWKSPQITNSSGIENRNENSSFPFKNFRVAKIFSDEKIYQGYVKSYDNTTNYWTVEYNDGDFEELNEEELEMAIDLFEKEDRRAVAKKAMVKCTTESAKSRSTIVTGTATSNNHELSYSSTARAVEHVNDNNLKLLTSLEQQVGDTYNSINKLEEKAFGNSQKGSLKDRIHKLRLFKLEKEVFGEAQTGDVREHLEKVKSFFSSVDI